MIKKNNNMICLENEVVVFDDLNDEVLNDEVLNDEVLTLVEWIYEI